MSDDKPIHLCVKGLGEIDIDESISHWKKTNDYVSWLFQSDKNVISDENINLLNKNISKFKNNFAYFIANNGQYVKKAKLRSVEGRGTKDGDKHLPDGWGGEAALWINCIDFEDSNLDELKYLLLESDEEPYLDLDKSRKLYPFRPRTSVNLVVFNVEPPPLPEKTKREDSMNNKEQILISKINDSIKKTGVTFSLQQITNYYLSLKTKPFVILTGISGTGKTKITELFAKAVCEDFQKQYLLLPVRPDWNDDKYLLGYYNPLTKKYQSTPFLEFIMQAEQDRQNPYFVCLDEMNLARVEYYFSTFLSAMESNKKIKLHSETDIKTESGKEISSEIEIPPNLFFTGTVNMDETTYRFSPKVLDRANTIEFTEIELLKPRENENSSSNKPDLVELFKRYFLKDEVRTNGITSNTYRDWENKNWNDLSGFLDSINKDSLEKNNLHFGYRIRDEILRYEYFAEKLGNSDFTIDTALDFQIKQKILPRIKGPESIRPSLESLRDKLAGKYLLSSAKINQMLEALQNGYTDFYQ